MVLQYLVYYVIHIPTEMPVQNTHLEIHQKQCLRKNINAFFKAMQNISFFLATWEKQNISAEIQLIRFIFFLFF